MLTPASPQAEALSHLFVGTLLICMVIFVVVTALVLICIVSILPETGRCGTLFRSPGNQRLEISWTVGSILILVALFVLTVRAMRLSDPVPVRPPDLTIIGHQWWWEARYPNGCRGGQ